MLSKAHSLEWLGGHYRHVIGVLFSLCISLSVSAKPEIPELATDTQLATAGYYQLSWHLGMDGASLKKPIFLLQQSSDQQFENAKTIYRGSDLSTVISGMPNGKYFYRLRLDNNANETHLAAWGDTVIVEVKHHSLTKAILFFSAGALVFLIALIFILRQAATSARER